MEVSFGAQGLQPNRNKRDPKSQGATTMKQYLLGSVKKLRSIALPCFNLAVSLHILSAFVQTLEVGNFGFAFGFEL